MRDSLHDTARHGANYTSPCHLDRLRATKMTRLGTPYCGALGKQNSCKCEACLRRVTYLPVTTKTALLVCLLQLSSWVKLLKQTGSDSGGYAIKFARWQHPEWSAGQSWLLVCHYFYDGNYFCITNLAKKTQPGDVLAMRRPQLRLQDCRLLLYLLYKQT